MSLWLSVVAQLTLHIVLGRRSSLWSSIITAMSCHHRCMLSMPKVAEGEVTWQWLAGVTKAARHCGY